MNVVPAQAAFNYHLFADVDGVLDEGSESVQAEVPGRDGCELLFIEVLCPGVGSGDPFAFLSGVDV